MVAEECKAIPRMIPNKWSFQTFDDCPCKLFYIFNTDYYQPVYFFYLTASVGTPITFLEILLSVQFEAFLWGLGTAIGELPPYFVA